MNRSEYEPVGDEPINAQLELAWSVLDYMYYVRGDGALAEGESREQQVATLNGLLPDLIEQWDRHDDELPKAWPTNDLQKQDELIYLVTLYRDRKWSRLLKLYPSIELNHSTRVALSKREALSMLNSALSTPWSHGVLTLARCVGNHMRVHDGLDEDDSGGWEFFGTPTRRVDTLSRLLVDQPSPARMESARNAEVAREAETIYEASNNPNALANMTNAHLKAMKIVNARFNRMYPKTGDEYVATFARVSKMIANEFAQCNPADVPAMFATQDSMLPRAMAQMRYFVLEEHRNDAWLHVVVQSLKSVLADMARVPSLAREHAEQRNALLRHTSVAMIDKLSLGDVSVVQGTRVNEKVPWTNRLAVVRLLSVLDEDELVIFARDEGNLVHHQVRRDGKVEMKIPIDYLMVLCRALCDVLQSDRIDDATKTEVEKACGLILRVCMHRMADWVDLDAISYRDVVLDLLDLAPKPRSEYQWCCCWDLDPYGPLAKLRPVLMSRLRNDFE